MATTDVVRRPSFTGSSVRRPGISPFDLSAATCDRRRLLLPSAVTVKPGLLPTPTIISTQVPPAPETKRLPSSTVSVAGTQKPVISTTTIEVPKLPKSTQTQQAQTQVLPTTTPKPIQLAQLPPATSPTPQPLGAIAQQQVGTNNIEKPKVQQPENQS